MWNVVAQLQIWVEHDLDIFLARNFPKCVPRSAFWVFIARKKAEPLSLKAGLSNETADLDLCD